jgi:hypothetical protein
MKPALIILNILSGFFLILPSIAFCQKVEVAPIQQNCQPELPYLDSIQKIRSLPGGAWKSYPYSDMHFAVVRLDQPGFWFVGFTEKERARFPFESQPCPDAPNVVFAPTLNLKDQDTIEHLRHNWIKNGNSLNVIQPDLSKISTQPILMVIPEAPADGLKKEEEAKKGHPELLEKAPSNFINHAIFMPGLWVHEIFHEFQDNNGHFKTFDREGITDALSSSTFSDDPLALKDLTDEAAQLKNLFNKLNEMKESEIAEVLEQVAARRKQGNKKAWHWLRDGERDESSARYVEAKALLSAGLIDEANWKKLIPYHLDMRDKPPPINWLYWYSSGAIMGLAMDRLDPEQKWQKIIEDGASFDQAAEKVAIEFRKREEIKKITEQLNPPTICPPGEKK